MKRLRASLGTRLSLAAAQGIINTDQKQWLRAVLAEGDPAVEDALDQLGAGNSSPLRALVESGYKNGALRARLATLSGQSSSSSSQSSSSIEGDLELLADDLRTSSISTSGDGDKSIHTRASAVSR